MFPPDRASFADLDVCDLEKVSSLYANCGAVAPAVKGGIGKYVTVKSPILEYTLHYPAQLVDKTSPIQPSVRMVEWTRILGRSKLGRNGEDRGRSAP